MAKLGELLVLLKAKNEVTTELTNTNTQLEINKKKWNDTTRNVETSQKGTARAMTQSRMAIRELAQGVGYLGTTFVGLGVTMKESNNEMEKSVGNTLLIAGTVMTAISSTAQFVVAIGRMIDALKKLRTAQILAQAFSGPAGWATLAVGAGVAVGAVAMSNKFSDSNSRVASTSKNQVTLENKIYLDGRELTYSVKKGIVTSQSQNGNKSGIK